MRPARVRDPGQRDELRLVGVGLCAIILLDIALLLLITETGYETWSPVLVFGGLVLVTIPLLRWWAGVERDRRLFWLMLLALVLKLGASFVRQSVTDEVYEGRADSGAYHTQATIWAQDLRSGDIELTDRGPIAQRPDRTRRVSIILAPVYVVLPDAKNVGNLFFSWLAFLGLFNAYRAFRIGYPEGSGRRYAWLVFFLPSLVYWPSAIGKDGWVLFCLGFAALGAAYILAPRPRIRGFAYLAAGIAGTALIRPHVSLVIVAGFAVAALFRAAPLDDASSRRGTIARIGAILLVVVGFLAVASQVEKFFGGEEFGNFGGDSVEAVFEQTAETTGQGGSVLDAEPVRTPADLPMAFVTVLFRPFPWEVGNFQAFLTSLEGMLLLALLVTSWKRVRNWFFEAPRRPYLVFAGMYTGAFIVAFSNILNAGILARQRTQVFIFALVVICVAEKLPSNTRGTDEGMDAAEETESVLTGPTVVDSRSVVSDRSAPLISHPRMAVQDPS